MAFRNAILLKELHFKLDLFPRSPRFLGKFVEDFHDDAVAFELEGSPRFEDSMTI
jgi:hypothetical protein